MKDKMIIREMIIKYKPKKCMLYEIIDNPEKAWKFMRKKIGDETQEMLTVIYLDSKNEAIGWAIISRGTLNESIFHSRDIFKIALLANACSIIVIHNHPSGNILPSEKDIRTTEGIIEAGKIIGIEMIDHIIISNEKYYSFKERGVLNGLSKI